MIYVKKPYQIYKGIVWYKVYWTRTNLKFFKSEGLFDNEALTSEEADKILLELNGGTSEQQKSEGKIRSNEQAVYRGRKL